MGRRELGDVGEAMARDYLERHGFVIIGQQVKIGRGEIDLIAKHRGEIIFVEVKTRTNAELGYPEEAIGVRKLEQLHKLAQIYMRGRVEEWRIDAVAITLSDDEPIMHLEGIY